MRATALRIMNKVLYKEVYPMDQLINLLGFESKDHVIDFLTHFNLIADDKVILLWIR